MPTLITLKFLALAIILLITLFAGWIPFRKHGALQKGHSFASGQALACGVFLGAGLIHMLGDADSSFLHSGFHYPWAMVIAGACFLFLLLIEHVSNEMNHHAHDEKAVTWVAILLLSIHSLLEGAALGLSTNMATGVILFLAIMAHKWAASFALSVQINQTHLSRATRYSGFLIFAIMTPLGIFFGEQVIAFSGEHSLLCAIFTAMAAGTFLFLGTLHGLTRATMIQQCCNLRQFCWMLVGFALMAVVAVWT